MNTVGLRVKSGFAVAIAVSGDADSWRIEQRREVALTAGYGTYARFPYHPLIELEGNPGATASRKAVAIVKSTAKKQMAALLDSLGAIDAAAVVVGSMIDPNVIGNPHIRVHAREGKLFREVIAAALDRRKIPYDFLTDKDAYAQVARDLGRFPAKLRTDIGKKGRDVVSPWRADEKLAALGAAWKLRTATARQLKR